MKTILNYANVMFCFLLMTSLTFAQETETRNLDSFDGISVASGIKAELVRGNTNKIEITADGIDLDKISTEVSGDKLKVKVNQKNNWFNWGSKKRTVNVTITYNSTLEYISSSSGSSVEADHTILASNLDLNTSSGAYMNITVEANDVEIGVSSGANMNVSGNASSVDIDISSGASLDAGDLESGEVTVDGSSGSSAKVYATSSLNVDVSSGASVRYKGNPGTTDFDKSSGGSVRKI